MDEGERQRLIEQTRKEEWEKIKQYESGYVFHGEMRILKGGTWNGHLFVIPDSEYKELFGR